MTRRCRHGEAYDAIADRLFMETERMPGQPCSSGFTGVGLSWLTADSIAELIVASLATLVTRLRDSRKFVLSAVINAPAMIAMKAVMMSTPLSTLPRWARSRSLKRARMAITG